MLRGLTCVVLGRDQRSSWTSGGHTNHSANGIVVRREVQDVWEAFFADEERILREDNK